MSAQSNLAIVLDFIGRWYVWLTLCVGVLVYLIGSGMLDVELLETVLEVVTDAIAKVNPWAGR